MTVINTNSPFFSIVIPAYNRENEIVRAIQSCLTQTFSDIEVVVTDDASVDGTVLAVENIDDTRVRLVRHEKNRGVCPARNTGIDCSLGEWVLFLDSDDEMAPGALDIIRNYCTECSDDIERLGFLFRRDDGMVSPDPVPPDCVLDYAGYLVWNAGLNPTATDFFHCTRRRAFENVRFPDNRAHEHPYLLRFAQLYKTRFVPEVVAIVHMDSANRDSNRDDADLVAKSLREAPDLAAEWDGILALHGSALRQYCPSRYRVLQKGTMMFHFLSGHRTQGLKIACSYLRDYPYCIEGWAILATGLIGPSALAWTRVWKLKARQT